MYVPFLKTKKGELDALAESDVTAKTATMPLFELSPPGKKNVDKALTEQIGNIRESWGSGPCYIDAANYYGEADSSGGDAFAFALQLAVDLGVEVVPVVSGLSPSTYVQSARNAAHRDQRGAAVRITRHDINARLSVGLPATFDDLRLGPPDVDVLLDWGAVQEGEEGFLAFTYQGLVSQFRPLQLSRRLILAASSFPESLKDVGQEASVLLPRTEWLAWLAIAHDENTRRVPTFGDYAVSHPKLPEGDPQNMAVTANIRYTTDSQWLIARGRPLKGNGFEQMRALSQAIVDHPMFSGPNFSWGDHFIADCASGVGGTGNSTTWVTVRTSHHVAFVTRQLANRPAA